MKRIVLIEDYEIIRNSYKEIIDATTDFTVVGDFESCEEALKKIEKLDPDIILIDITLPGMNGIQGIYRIKSKLNNVKFIVVTVHEHSKYVFEALCAGAIGYLTKNSGKDKIVDALRQADMGGSPMSMHIARMVVKSFRVKRFEELSERENEVLFLLAKGKTYSNIADELFLSINTIKGHVKRIYEKLHVNSKDEVIKLVNDREF